MEGNCLPAARRTFDSMIAQMEQYSIDFGLNIGDISYANGNAVRWDQFFYELEPLATKVPWMASIGNHDYDYYTQPFRPPWSNYGGDSFGECGIPFKHRFSMPNNNQYWWSIEYGNIHLSIWSAEHNFSVGSEQWKWHENDLKNVNRSKTPFVIVGNHRPMYSSGDSKADYIMSLHIRSELEDLFFKYKVDLALYGHYHNYERSCRVYKEICGNGTIHVVIGMGGANLTTSWMPQPKWSLIRDAKHYGYSVIQTDEDSLHFQYFGNDIYPIDEFWIRK